MAGYKNLSLLDATDLKVVNVADGTNPKDAVNRGQLDAGSTADRSRANHTGTQAASTISDFTTAVRQNRLDQMAAPTSPVALNNQRLTGGATATTDTDVPTWGQVKDLLSGARKTDARFAVTSNDTLSGLAARDGVTPTAGQRALVVGQTDETQNGIYLTASGAWTRAEDADTAAEFATAWLITTKEGDNNQDVLWTFTTDAAVTLGTTPLRFKKIGPISSGAATGYNTTCPAVAAGNSWTVTHGLGTRAVIAQVSRAGSPYDVVGVRIERTGLNQVTVLPDVAMAAGEYEINVQKVA